LLFFDINKKKLYNASVYRVYIIKLPGGLNMGDYVIKDCKEVSWYSEVVLELG